MGDERKVVLNRGKNRGGMGERRMRREVIGIVVVM